MKRTALNHSKTKKLSRLLRLPHYAAVGLLECLWHLTANEAPRGDIGKLSDDDIAFSIDWEQDPVKLVAALVDAGWIERNEEHRLVVHHWSEHCEDAVDAKVYRMGTTYADGTEPKGTKVGTKEKLSIVGRKADPVLNFQPESQPQKAPEKKPADFTPGEVALAVIQDAQAGGTRALMTLTDIAKSLMGAGANADQARTRMFTSWTNYKQAAGADKLKWTYSAIEKFFAGGMWDKPEAWPWKEGKQPKPQGREKILA